MGALKIYIFVIGVHNSLLTSEVKKIGKTGKGLFLSITLFLKLSGEIGIALLGAPTVRIDLHCACSALGCWWVATLSGIKRGKVGWSGVKWDEARRNGRVNEFPRTRRMSKDPHFAGREPWRTNIFPEHPLNLTPNLIKLTTGYNRVSHPTLLDESSEIFTNSPCFSYAISADQNVCLLFTTIEIFNLFCSNFPRQAERSNTH